MTEKKPMLEYQASPKRRGSFLVIIGSCAIVTAGMMAMLGASIFTMAVASPPVDWLGRVCFWAYMPVLVIGIALLVTGLAWRR
jgi:hypothetical protein